MSGSKPNPRNANGHRRRQLRARVLATETYCAWEHCPWPDEPVPKRGISHLDPKAPEVDEIIPIRHGGDPLVRANVQLMHRYCNQQRYQVTRKRSPVPPPDSFGTSRDW